MNVPLKTFATIGCCGIDCGLCPRFYTCGNSACPGCGGLNFSDKHPSCGFLTCCVIKKNFEVCSDCHEFPCKRFEPEKFGMDSFVTHRKIFENLDSIKAIGIEKFTENQKHRMDILSYFLAHFDDGRSKSFYCISCTLLPIQVLDESFELAHKIIGDYNLKERCRLLRNRITEIAEKMNIELKLKNKKN